MGIHNEVVTWFPDSKRIVFLSRQRCFQRMDQAAVQREHRWRIAGAVADDQGGLASFSADGNKIAYNQIFRNFRTWKRYTGGLAQDISIYDLKNNTVEDLPHTDWTDTFPMWHGNTIYFTSDRGPEHHLNLYSYDIASKQVAQLTHFTDFDVMWPSLGPDAIIFENGGYLYTLRFPIEAGEEADHLSSRRTRQAMKHWVSVSNNITDFDISPEGKRAVFAARGDVFTVPAKEGSIRNLTRTPGIREKSVAWSPDGRWIAYVSDRTGEDEIYITPQDGMGKEQQITSGYKGFKFPPVWSPDSKKIAWADKDLRLWYVDIDDKKPVQMDPAQVRRDPQLLLVAGQQVDGLRRKRPTTAIQWSICIRWRTGKSLRSPTSMTNSNAPMFDPEGKYLYFLSDRDYNEVLGNIDFEFANPKTTRIYIVTLRKDDAFAVSGAER